MPSRSRSPRPSPPPCPPPPPPSPQSPPPPMPLSPRSQARHAAAIISAIDAGFPLVRREIPDSEDDSEDPNVSAHPPALPLRTTTQQHRHLDSLPTYLHHRALRNHHEADLEAAARTAESNASDGCDAMEICEEATTTTTTTNASTAAESSASG
ncbi:MAG: hypothetical protein Q9215_002516, partial [Flavoplaca cf. flavocitrina]